MDRDEVDARPSWAIRSLRLAGSFRRRLIDLVLPPMCVACQTPVADPQALCSACWGNLQFIERPYCQRLGIPFGYDLGPGALSAEAIAHPPVFNRARAAVVYGRIARELVQALKYRDRTELGPFLGKLMARSGSEILESAEVIVPVPLHRWRLFTRRFNQAAVLAQAVGTLAGRAVEVAALRRVRATRSQVGLSGLQRVDNMRGAFAVDPDRRPRIEGLRVVLVDDVYTTGATLSAATRALQRAGAANVDVLTFARALISSDGDA